MCVATMVNDHHIRIQNVMDCLRSTLKVEQGKEKYFVQRKMSFRGCRRSTVRNHHIISHHTYHDATIRIVNLSPAPFSNKTATKEYSETVILLILQVLFLPRKANLIDISPPGSGLQLAASGASQNVRPTTKTPNAGRTLVCTSKKSKHLKCRQPWRKPGKKRNVLPPDEQLR